ncbi:MAG: amidohydrolase family protein [Anaerolineales bacterium]|nr:amidohydrolase family protein [Anaerolineales bacterium]
MFRGRDIPLKGYLLSRSYPEWWVRLAAPLIFTVIENAVRGESRGFLVDLVKRLVFAYTGAGYRRWADILSLEDMGDVARRLIDTFQKDRIGLYVPLMIDYEYWFKPSKNHPIVDQIDSMYRDVILPNQGRVHPFAPFDPARELAYRAKLPPPGVPDGGPPEKYSSLELAKEAVRNKGFVGVKVYNTLGYRPIGNAAVDAHRRSIFRRNGLARCERFTGEEFDEVMAELYRFCRREEVPITGHCVYSGVEAYPGASYDFGAPAHWRAMLERYPGLHVNLAHFGWNRPEEYFAARRRPLFRRSVRAFQRRMAGAPGPASDSAGGEQGADWVREIAGMLPRFPGLYADVAHHMVMEDADIPKFREAYAAMCRDFPGVIQKRLLFGIDWHVVTRVDRYAEFLERYRRVLEEGSVFRPPEMKDFLGGNALRFLGLLPPSRKENSRWSKNWRRLKSFYRKNRIRPPKWFRDASLMKE